MQNTSGWQGMTPRQAGALLNRNAPRITADFQKELSQRVRLVSQQIQNKINSTAKGGVVPFTSKAILFNYKNVNGRTENQILVKQLQTKYLKWMLDDSYTQKQESKIIPFSTAKLNQQGNITGLKSNLANGKFKKQKDKHGRTYIIDTRKKKGKSKQDRLARIIGVIRQKKRKPLFDFYQETLTQVNNELSDLRGSFNYTFR
ncbi:Uncharacterised protein [Yersinia pekkanenii]|uniref:Uncharacterized protein n=1 Tax=Yersinia pekkanenii TaxID=1288385 RepID=A0A0T9PU70_9GAMM|nr:hypothetical protein [Yersinia pekkanenii]CNH80544.1 Uncharacterised protein [Yersinia pekkanenii]